MKKTILMFILLIISSCKTENSENKKEIINDNNETISEGVIIPEIPEIAEIGHIFKPEWMEQTEIENLKGKNDYKYILTNSDLLDKDLKNIRIYAEQIVDLYYDFLIRINKPFNFEKIIVEIQHRNGKIDVFKYSQIDMKEILNKRNQKE